jgi:hypothetical protein
MAQDTSPTCLGPFSVSRQSAVGVVGCVDLNIMLVTPFFHIQVEG